jgi:hypothetical protein
MISHRLQFHVSLAPNAAAAALADVRAQLPHPGLLPERFEILFIEAAEANGFTFSPRVLEDSLALWENCAVFVDHAPFGRSVRDLGGVLNRVRFNPEYNGLTAELTPAGPSAEIVREAARLLLSERAHPDLGFSADLLFTADASNNVEKILQPLSVDLVIEPAFATRFIRQLNSKGVHVSNPNPNPPAATDEDLRATLQAQHAALQAEAGKQLVELTLHNAALPEAAAGDIRSRFAGKAFRPEELSAAVEAWKTSLAEVEAPAQIRGPARVHSMFDSHDQAQAAVDDLLGAPREPGAESLQVSRLQGVREAYLMLSGDRDFTGGFFPERVRFQHTTTNFPGLVTNSLNKALARKWERLGRAGYDWWQKIASVEHFNSLNEITWMLFGSVASLPDLDEGEEYPELKIGDSHEHSSFVKYGGYVGVTLEALDRDDTRKLRAIPRELAAAGLRNISALVAGIFTANSGAGPTMNDTGALFNNTAVTTRGGHANLGNAALGADYTAWNAIALAMHNQPLLVADEAGYYGAGKKCALWPKYCLVPAGLRAQAEALFMPRWQSQVDAIASSGGPTWGGRVEVVSVPEWTDATDYAAAQDPALMPGVMIGERFGLTPQIFVAGSESDPAMFANDESRIKVRHFVAVGVSDFRPLYKSNNP